MHAVEFESQKISWSWSLWAWVYTNNGSCLDASYRSNGHAIVSSHPARFEEINSQPCMRRWWNSARSGSQHVIWINNVMNWNYNGSQINIYRIAFHLHCRPRQGVTLTNLQNRTWLRWRHLICAQLFGNGHLTSC